jgi:hypothetical protein
MRGAAGALLLALLAFPRVARADAPADCDSAYERGQELQRAGKLAEARTQFEICSQKACAPFEVADCTRWLREVEAATPPASPPVTPAPSQTVTPTAPSPPPLPSPSPVAPTLQATPVESPSPPGEPATTPLLVYALGGAGLTAVLVGAVIDAKGYFGDTAALSKCSPTCPLSQTNAARTELLVGDVTLGIGVALVGVAAWLYFEGRGADHARTTSRVVVDPGGVTWVF